ncbi:MAG: tetratricopeptide repeat protein [Candidatus Omnitrophica bacterium]|nr:tetratricopeptide repeat protein [Candidatus Omnitrophota bacterium]
MSKDIYDKEAKNWVYMLLIIFLGFLVYANSLNGKFIWDDDALIKDNVNIRSLHNMENFFVNDSTNIAKPIFYRPFQMITYAADYSVWKLNFRGYHLTSILLHILTALLLYWLVSILCKDAFIALLASMFFVVHPVHTEAVAYISGRSDSLAGIFMLLSFIFYIKRVYAGKISFYILMILSYIGALLSRETTLILPLLLLAYHCVFKEKIRLKDFFTFLIVSFIYIALIIFILPPVNSYTTFFQRLPGFFVAVASYIRLLILPFWLHMGYGIKLFNLTDPKAIAGIIALVFLLFYVLKNKNRKRIIVFSILWFLIALLPVSNLYPVNAYMSEHWLYIPSVGFFMILSGSLSSVYRIKRFHAAGMALIIGLLVFYSYLTIKQNKYWRTPVDFYNKTIKYAPDDWRLYVNLGNAYINIGKNEKAVASYKKALAVNPNASPVYISLGIVYNNAGRKKEAIAMFRKALKINPEYATAYFCLSKACFYEKQYSLAIKYCDKAIELGFTIPVKFLENLREYKNYKGLGLK